MPSSYHYLVLPKTFNKSHLLDLLCLHLYPHSPSAISIVVIDIIVITPYCLVAQPAVVWLATAYEATCAAIRCTLHSLSDMYIRDDTLECSPAFSLFPTTKFPLYFSTSAQVMMWDHPLKSLFKLYLTFKWSYWCSLLIKWTDTSKQGSETEWPS